MSMAALRKQYHQDICMQVIRVKNGVPNIADKDSETSKAIALASVQQLRCRRVPQGAISGQTAGKRFEDITRSFLQRAFALLQHLRPGDWEFSVTSDISHFEQYKHLADLQETLKENPQLKSTIGLDYLITPDVVIARCPVSDDEINSVNIVIAETNAHCQYTPLRAANNSASLLHASISCKWTIRSDRAQNIRAEALNLVRNRKGHTPHIVAVTAEPLPTRLASLALGTGDLDCVYHFALPELRNAVVDSGSDGQLDMLTILINGNRLRDISDLPLDLAI